MKTNVYVILPVYKGDRIDYLSQAIDSVLEQTFRDFILIIVKDGKLSDEQEEKISLIGDKRIIYLELKEHKGLPTALNSGIREAINRGADYIIRMDADDIALPKRFEMQLAYMEEMPMVEVVGMGAILIDDRGERIGEKIVKKYVSFDDMLRKCELIHPTVIFRKCFFEKYGFYDENLLKSQDYDLWLRALSYGAKIHNIDDRLLKFRYETAIVTRRKKEQDFNILIKKKYLSGFKLYRSIIKHLAIKYLPNFIISYLLNKKIKNAKIHI